MPLDQDDHDHLLRAIDLAHQSIGLSEPNPRVGCVLHDAHGELAGEGFTQQAGGPHAEVMALRQAAAAGRSLQGGTAWVSLEPCAHHGRTPPCCDALIAAGLARVVVATTDPYPRVAGQGIARLRAAGLRVDLAEGELTRTARELNIGFFSRVLRQRPWVRLKVAASMDGRTALRNGVSQWITGPHARADGHHWRKRAGAVLTGIGTVRDDDPRLDVRLVDTVCQPLRIVLDSTWSLPLSSRLLQPPGRVLVVGAAPDAGRIAALQQLGAETLALPGPLGRVDLSALLAHLAHQGVNELHVEAGARLNAAWLQGGHVDEVLAYVAPMLIGPGAGLADWEALTTLSQAVRLRFIDCQMVGDDLRVRARAPGCEDFLA